MEILTAAEMAETDRRTAEQFGIPLAKLMENAGTAVAKFCLRQYPSAKSAIVLCGKGNNGGDGFVAARMLAQAGLQVRVLLLGQASEAKGEAAAALKRLKDEASSVVIEEMRDGDALSTFEPSLREAELIVDAVVGTGFKPPLRGTAIRVRAALLATVAPVVAVDLPSGWDADSTAAEYGWFLSRGCRSDFHGA